MRPRAIGEKWKDLRINWLFNTTWVTPCMKVLIIQSTHLMPVNTIKTTRRNFISIRKKSSKGSIREKPGQPSSEKQKWNTDFQWMPQLLDCKPDSFMQKRKLYARKNIFKSDRLPHLSQRDVE